MYSTTERLYDHDCANRDCRISEMMVHIFVVVLIEVKSLCILLFCNILAHQ